MYNYQGANLREAILWEKAGKKGKESFEDDMIKRKRRGGNL